MKILTLKQKLYQGKTPDELGAVKIGEGMQKTAYSIEVEYYGKLVLKENTGGWRDCSRRPPSAIKRFNARAPFMWFTKKWCIQEFVTPVCCQKSGQWNTQDKKLLADWELLYNANLGDMHQFNCGFSEKGELVVFDW